MSRGSSDRLTRARILIAGLKARRSAAVVLFLVAVLSVAAAAIGPIFLQSADTSVLSSSVAAAPPGQSDLTIISSGNAKEMALLSAATKAIVHQANGLLSPAIFTADVGSHFVYKGQQYGADLLARTSVCSHLSFPKGGCPTKVDEVALSERSAAASGLRVGTSLKVEEPHSATVTTLTVSGIYVQPATVNTNYWKDNYYFDFGTGTPPVVQLDPLVATLTTVLSANPLTSPQLSADLPWRAGAAFSGAPALEATVANAKSTLVHDGLTVTTGLGSVIAATRHEDDLMSTVVLVIVLQLLLLSLLILYSLGRTSILGRRQESEFARRHGFPRRALIALAIGEPVALIAAALPLGVVLAWGTDAVLTRTLFIHGTPVSFPFAAILYAVGASLAGVIALAVASSELWRSRALSLRQVKLASLGVDAFALAMAFTGLISLATKGSLGGSHANPLAALAPGLLAIGAGVIGLRLAAAAVKAMIGRSSESGRVAWFLALRQIGRRPSVLRQVLPLTAAVAVVLFAIGSFFLASSNRSEVANFEVGAARVVDVTPPPGFNLETAVRAADPSGREAMAAAYYSSSTGALLAVDSSRLSAVGYWPAFLAKEPIGVLAKALTPIVAPGVTFTGDLLRFTIGVPQGVPPIELGVDIFDETYQDAQTFYVGPVSGVHSYTLSVSCPHICRVTGLIPNWVNPFDTYSKNVPFVLRGVASRSKGTWTKVGFGAGRRHTWGAEPESIGVASSPTTCCTVTFTIPGLQLQSAGLLLSPVDLPAAVPAIMTRTTENANPPSPPGRSSGLDFDGTVVTERPVAVVPTLPFLGQSGALVDYVFAQRAILNGGEGTTFQVWLAPSASPVILQRLHADGVSIGPLMKASTRLGVLDHGGVAFAYAVALIVSPIAALLAIGALVFVIVSDGRRRRREFGALTMAGIPARALRRALLLENAVVLGITLVVGALIGFASDSLALASLPEFSSGSDGLAVSRAVPLVPFLTGVGVLALLFVVAVVTATTAVMRGARRRTESGSME